MSIFLPESSRTLSKAIYKVNGQFVHRQNKHAISSPGFPGGWYCCVILLWYVEALILHVTNSTLHCVWACQKITNQTDCTTNCNQLPVAVVDVRVHVSAGVCAVTRVGEVLTPERQ